MTDTKKEHTPKKRKYTLQQGWCIYLMANCIFLLPVMLLTAVFSRINVPHPTGALYMLSECIGMLFLGYWIPVILYYLFRLMYLHFALSLGFLGFSVYKLTKEKNGKLFCLILLLTAVSAALNVYWLMNGRSYTIV